MVWNTTQSARYNTECCRERKCTADRKTRSETFQPPPPPPPRPSAQQHKRCSPFDDGDTLLLMVLLYILVREKTDQTLIMSLLIAMLM